MAHQVAMINKYIFVSCLITFLSKICFLNALHVGINDSGTNDCRIQNLKPWIYFPYDVCLHLIVDDNQYPSDCITTLIDTLTANGIVIYQKSLTHLQNRNISNRTKTNCESYVFVMEEPEVWFRQVDHHQQTNKTKKIFHPYARFYFLSLYGRDLSPFGSVATFFYRNAIFGYKFMFDAVGQVESIRDVVTDNIIKGSPNFTDLSHPFVDTKNENHEFRVSVYECPPHTIYLDKNGSRKDGVEYRFLTHVLKNWKIQYLQQNESMIPFNPYGSMFNQMAEGQSDMAMCGIWLSLIHSNKDLTSYFNNICNTWIAPKPRKIDPAALIYLTLSAPVWGVYIFCFLLTAILLTFISKIEEDLKDTRIVTATFGRSLLEAANTATSHGMSNFPVQFSVQILLVSWILLNLLVGLGYTTIYTSRLASPGHTKSIDTVEDFVDQGISWLTRHEYSPALKTLNESTRPAFKMMYKNFAVEHSEEQLVKRLRTGHYGVFMSICSHKYAVDTERITHPSAEGIWNLFQFMKVCFYSYFSTFALPKHSPYTALLNAHIKQYQECGIIMKWYADLYRGQNWMNTLFVTHPMVDEEAEPLTLWNMKGAFAVLFTGHLIAILSYFFELTYYKLKMFASK